LSWSPWINTTGYNSIPLTATDALADGWFNGSTTCDNGGQFNGFQFYLQNSDGSFDTSVSALYDINGVVVGFQMNIPVSVATANANNNYQWTNIPMFLSTTVNGVATYTLTAYLVDPSTICNTGRNVNDLQTVGTGTGLWFQNGTDPTQLFQAPMNRPDALNQGWSNNKCFVGMGVHNWYQQETYDSNDCATVLPAFLLYNLNDTLIGWGFEFVGTAIAPRYEQPPAAVIKTIVGDNVSQCLIDHANGVGVTTMHVFLTTNPFLQNCVIND